MVARKAFGLKEAFEAAGVDTAGKTFRFGLMLPPKFLEYCTHILVVGMAVCLEPKEGIGL